ncbi:Serine/threonine-protein phosphatase 6 regulatory subunit 3, partial [Stegodyphus mimosarum]
MFWRYNLITGSCIETLLDKENVTLKELMEEEDILQECKAQTKKLLDFLVRPEIMDEMVSLITQEPSDEGDEKLRYRYSNRACELLTFDIAQINDALANDEALLLKLYNFLNTEKPLNPLLASFFSKTMGLLIAKRTDLIFNFLKDKDFITLILNHLDTSAVMDLLLRFITSIENNDMRNTVIKWLNDQRLIEQLVNRIDVEYGEDVNCNASHALCDVIKVSREHMSLLQEKAEPNPLLQTVESVEVVTELLNHMFKDVKKESAIVNGVLVLLALLMFKKQGPAGVQQIPSNQSDQPLQADNAPVCFLTLSRSNEAEQMTALDAERLSHGVNNVLAAIISYLENFHNLLLKPPVKPAITLTIGCLDPPLGYCRLEVAHLLTALLSTNNHEVNMKLAELKTINVLMDMFFKYSWNNFLHTQVEQALGRIITNSPTVDKEGNKVHPLLEQVLTHYKITVKILDNFEEFTKPIPGSHRKGYMGHLTKIANHIAQNAESGVNSNLIKEKIKDISEEHCKKWEEFVIDKLAEINKRNTTYVVSGPPVPSSSTDEDSVDFRDIPFGKESSVHLAFSDYQMHEMTSNFVDQFGFNDDEFGDADESLIYARNALNPLSQNFPLNEGNSMRSAEIFEEVCRVKINPDGDAVLWADREHSTFNTCFRLSKSSEEESSDSDEESQVFETENAPIVMSSEEMKMDVDNHEAIFDGVPMDVAPVTIPNPWESTETTSSDDQGNWADFSNFAAFGASTSEHSEAVSVAMETSDSTTSCEKC